MPLRRILAALLAAVLLAAGWWSYRWWHIPPAAATDKHDHSPFVEMQQVKLSPQQQANLQLRVAPLEPEGFWLTAQLPGTIIDRPALSDRGIVTPVTAVVVKVHHFPGDTVAPGETLFTLRLLSETMQLAQTELFKTAKDIEIAEEEYKRRDSAAKSGAISESSVIEVKNQLRRLTVAAQAYRTELQSRGLSREQIDSLATGKFVSTIEVKAPLARTAEELLYEVQELKVDLGQQVQAGQMLCLLSNHQVLYIEGRAFRQETALLERAVRESWPLEVEFLEAMPEDREFELLVGATLGQLAAPFAPGPLLGAAALQPARLQGWAPLAQSFAIRHIANTIDPASRTFAFYVPLNNQSRSYEKDGKTLLLWQYRPGQKVRLHIRVDRLEDVFVLPADAVVHEGAETFVFWQNGEMFERKPVRLVHEDRRHAVLANDGSVPAGVYVVQNAAAQINRVLKSQSGGGLPPGFHMHADGSIHSNAAHK